MNFPRFVDVSSARKQWWTAQILVVFMGLAILASLRLSPELGLLLFWDVLIPLAPLLFVLIPGVWRNVCPLGFLTLLPRKLRWSRQLTLNYRQSSILNLTGLLAFVLIVSLRHSYFNENATATAVLILSLGTTGFLLNLIFDWKSAWCSGLCPVLPIEKLYGHQPILSTHNSHCTACVKCVNPCPDSTVNFHPVITKKTNIQNLSSILTIGGMPGFIWGWFQVADRVTFPSLHGLLEDFQYPTAGMIATALVYWILYLLIPSDYRRYLNRLFAAAAVSCYYWFRVPALLGFGVFPSDGCLIDLSQLTNPWTIQLVTIGLTFFFSYQLVLRAPNKKRWLVRPAFVRIRPQDNP